MSRLEFGLGKAIGAIRKKKAKLILLQFPEGLKTKTAKIAKEIEEKTGVKTITLVNPCYGACDIPLQEMKLFGADLAIHFGHTKMLEGKNVVYIPFEYSIAGKTLERLAERLSKKIRKRKFKKIGIVATAQYFGHLKIAKRFFRRSGFKVLVHKGGQVLGCDTSAAEKIRAKVDCFVFVGDGRFHPLGVAVNTGKHVFTLNPLNRSVSEIPEKETERMERARIARVSIAKNAKSFGIIVSTKSGQFWLKKALELKIMAEKRRKKALILASDEVREEYLLGLNLECFVNTACPRLVLDDSVHWKKLLICAEEMQEALE